MDSYPEKLPATLEKKQFPMGDINLSHKIEMIDQWIEDKSAYDSRQLGNYLGYRSRPQGTDKFIVHKNHAAAIELCKHWDEQQDELKLTAIGFGVIRAFTNDIPSLLPVFDKDVTDVLLEMRTNHPIDARHFGKFAWAGMQFSHPSLSAQLEKIIDMFEGRFGLDDSARRERFLAGLTLPYVMAAYARMEGYYRIAKVSGVKIGTVEELEAMEFPRIFSRDS